MFEVASEQFSGPLELLLQLVEQEELSLTDVSLAKVAEAYIAYIEQHEPPADELADFLLIATRLLLLKSRLLLPTQVVEEEEQMDLAEQLRLYKQYVDLSAHVVKIYDAQNESFAKQKPEVIPSEGPTIPEDLSTQSLKEAFERVVKLLEPFARLQEVAMERVVSVKERLQELKGLIAERAKLSFKELMKSGASKVEVVISFLALLELVKQRTVHVTQSGSFDDIEINRVDD